MSRHAMTPRVFAKIRAGVTAAVGRRFMPAFRKAFPEARIYLVGGAVRDALLGSSTKDIDLVVRGVPSDVLERFLGGLGRVDFVGRTFGVFKFVPKDRRSGDAVDIALPRTEWSLGSTGAYRDFRIASDPKLPIEEDLRRRDFTVNAMAVEIAEGLLIDPHGGRDDLSRSLLRTVGAPAERFQEDYSRILRAVRLACKLHFNIEEETWNGLARLSPRVNDRATDGEYVVPREIIARELILAFTSDPVRALDMSGDSGLMEALLPELAAMKGCPQPPNYHSEGDVWTHTRLALERANSDAYRRLAGKARLSAEVIFGILLHDVGKPVTMQTPERHGTDRIRFNEHDRVGGEMTRRICDRLKLSQFPKESSHHLDAGRLSWIVEKHLLLINDADVLKSATVEKYFFNPAVPGQSLLRVILADILATIPQGGSPDLRNFQALLKRIRRLRAMSKSKRKLVPPLLDGREIMAIMGLPPSPKIGKLLLQLREAQLEGRIKTKDEAKRFLKSLI